MLKVKLGHNKTEIKNEKVAKMMEFIKTPNPRRFNFGKFFNSIILSTPHPKTLFWRNE